MRVSIIPIVMLATVFSGNHASAQCAPYWNGRTPHVWTSETDPLCHPRYIGRHGILRVDNHGPEHRAVCAWLGPGRELAAWNA